MKKLTSIIITLLVVSIVALNYSKVKQFVEYKNAENSVIDEFDSHDFNFPQTLLINRIPVEPITGFASSEYLNIPDSYSPIKFKVQEPINLVVNQDFLRYPDGEYESLSFLWDFGDGTRTISGPRYSHQYNDIGSYIASVSILEQLDTVAGTDPKKSFSNQIGYAKTRIDVVPETSYTMPEATLVGFQNPMILSGRRTQYIFSANQSTAGTPIKYLVDFGDGYRSVYSVNSHTFENNNERMQVVLRVTDRNNFFSDENIFVYTNLEKKDNIFNQYRTFFFRKIENALNKVFSEFSLGETGRLGILLSVLYLGMLQVLLSPLVVLLLILYGRVRKGTKMAELFNMFFSNTILKIFFSMVFSFTTVYFVSGFLIAEVFTQAFFVMSALLLFLIFSVFLLKAGSRNSNNMNLSTLGVALGILPNPFTFTVYAQSTYVLGMADAVYLLSIFVIGSAFGSALLVYLGPFLKYNQKV